jgi:hypothetical protein
MLSWSLGIADVPLHYIPIFLKYLKKAEYEIFIFYIEIVMKVPNNFF